MEIIICNIYYKVIKRSKCNGKNRIVIIVIGETNCEQIKKMN